MHHRKPALIAIAALLVGLAGAALAPSDASAEQAGSKIHRRASGFLAAGARFSCARLDTGRVRCWGNGDDGALGYGNTNDIGDNETPGSVGPVDLGAGRTARAIAAGFYHTCAILDNGQVRCWGAGFTAQLGYGNTTHRRQRDAGLGRAGRPRRGPDRRGDHGRRPSHLRDPRQRHGALLGLRRRRPARLRQHERHRRQRDAGVGRARSTSARAERRWRSPAAATTPARCSTTARCAAGATGGYGRLGYGNTRTTSATTRRPARSGPVDLGAGRKAVAITRRLRHTCALLDNGKVRCWGAASSGQLGYGNTKTIGDDETPASVATGEPRRQAQGDRDHRRRPTHLRGPRQPRGALLGHRPVRPARLRQHAEHRRQREPRLRGPGQTSARGETPSRFRPAAVTPSPCSTTAGPLLGPRGRRPARLRQHNNIGDNETPGSAGPVSLGGLVGNEVSPARASGPRRRSPRPRAGPSRSASGPREPRGPPGPPSWPRRCPRSRR